NTSIRNYQKSTRRFTFLKFTGTRSVRQMAKSEVSFEHDYASFMHRACDVNDEVSDGRCTDPFFSFDGESDEE
ncbi:MAG TPA: hypothetical protein VFV79_06080, partial [Saprospiraceae bacterium]|nr:hypothetical protein [Saprospiraceae bacterium]